jgi:hypothetical protein
MLMKVLLGVLALSVATIAVVVVAMWLRLRWHLRGSNDPRSKTLVEIQPEHETAEIGPNLQ